MLRPIWRMRRGTTLGAQGAIIDGEGRVMLVRHSYRPGWWFPGGGVEWGETLEAALAREIEEEVGVTATEPPELHGVFANFANFPGDHIAVFVVRHWRRQDSHSVPREIAEWGLFRPDDLPPLTDIGTRKRLAEILGRASKTQLW